MKEYLIVMQGMGKGALFPNVTHNYNRDLRNTNFVARCSVGHGRACRVRVLQ